MQRAKPAGQRPFALECSRGCPGAAWVWAGGGGCAHGGAAEQYPLERPLSWGSAILPYLICNSYLSHVRKHVQLSSAHHRAAYHDRRTAQRHGYGPAMAMDPPGEMVAGRAADQPYLARNLLQRQCKSCTQLAVSGVELRRGFRLFAHRLGSGAAGVSKLRACRHMRAQHPRNKGLVALNGMGAASHLASSPGPCSKNSVAVPRRTVLPWRRRRQGGGGGRGQSCLPITHTLAARTSRQICACRYANCKAPRAAWRAWEGRLLEHSTLLCSPSADRPGNRTPGEQRASLRVTECFSRRRAMLGTCWAAAVC